MILSGFNLFCLSQVLPQRVSLLTFLLVSIVSSSSTVRVLEESVYGTYRVCERVIKIDYRSKRRLEKRTDSDDPRRAVPRTGT